MSPQEIRVECLSLLCPANTIITAPDIETLTVREKAHILDKHRGEANVIFENVDPVPDERIEYIKHSWRQISPGDWTLFDYASV